MTHSQQLRDVFEFIDSHAEVYLDRLKDLCKQETVASQRKGIPEGAQRVANLVRAIGGEPKLLPVGETTYVLTRLSGQGDSTLGFYNHFDTHPAGNTEEWISPPFAPTIRDGALYARGATDNKGNLVARLCAVEAYCQVRKSLPLNLIFLHDGEEEVGSPHMGTFVDQYHALIGDADGWVWEGGFKDQNDRLALYLGFNGLVYAEFEALTTREDNHGSRAGLIPNAAWRLVWALSTIKAPDETITIDGFNSAVRPQTESERALVKALPFDPAEMKRDLGIAQWAGGSSWEDALERQYLSPFINLTGIGGGYQGDGAQVILPHRAVAKMEIYLADGQDPDLVEQQLRSHLNARGFSDIKFKVLAKMPPSRTNASSGLATAVLELIGGLYDKPPVIYPIMPGASPMGYLTGRFRVPGVSTGVGYINSRMHQPNENVRVKDFIQGIKLMAALIDRMAQPGQTWQ